MPQAFWAVLYKMAARGHFVIPIDANIHRVLVILDLNGYGEYEFESFFLSFFSKWPQRPFWKSDLRQKQ